MRKGILTIFLASFLIAFTIHPALASYSPCAAGLGDPLYPNLGNACYQVEHYDLNLRFDPATGLLRGEALLDIVLTNSVTDGFAVDLTSDMAIQAVTLDGSTVGYSRPTTDDVSIGLIGGYIPQARSTAWGSHTPATRLITSHLQLKLSTAQVGCGRPRAWSLSVSRMGRIVGSRQTTIQPTKRPSQSR